MSSSDTTKKYGVLKKKTGVRKRRRKRTPAFDIVVLGVIFLFT